MTEAREMLDGVLFVLKNNKDAETFHELTGLAACGIGTSLGCRHYREVVVLAGPEPGQLEEHRDWVTMGAGHRLPAGKKPILLWGAVQ